MARVPSMTLDELLDLPVSVDVVTAGRALGLGRCGTYDVLARGEFPVRTVRVGRATRVPRAELFRVLGVDDSVIRGSHTPAHT
jgi:hypothetical protein